MAARELSLFADLDQGRLVTGFSSTLQATLPRFVFGDSIPVSFRALKSNANGSAPWSEVDLTGKTVRIAIGNPAGEASSGTFTLTYGANTTTDIAYDATGATIETALNALASITAAGGVSVTKAATGVFRIVFDVVGSRTAITADTSSLYPSSGAELRVAVEGDGSTKEIVVARIENSPAAYAELADNLPVAAATITETRTGSGTVGAINTIEFTVIPYAGHYTLQIGTEETASIPWDATAATIETALEALTGVGADMVSVTGEYPVFAMSFDLSLGDIGAITADLTGLVVPTGRAGELNLNTAEMVELLNGAAQASAKLEVELYDISGATTWTVLQVDCTVIDDVIANSPASTTDAPTYVTTETLAAMNVGSTAPVNEDTATSELEVMTLPTAGQTLIITSGASIETFTFAATGVEDFEVAIGATLADCATNITAALESFSVLVVAIPSGGANRVIEAQADGTAGNGITFTGTTITTDKIVCDTTAGGVDATVAPPYLRTAGGFLYIQEASVWKKAAISAL